MILDDLKEKVKGKKIRIVFTEGEDYRIQEAAVNLVKDDICVPVLLGKKDEIEATSKKYNFDLTGTDIIDPATYDNFPAMFDLMMKLRAGKITEDKANELLQQTNYFGTMLVKMGEADGLLGAARSTKNFGKDPVVALLSFSTNGSAKGDDVTKMKECLAKLKEMPLDFPVDGEMQFDCAVNEDVAQKKFPSSKVAGHANTFIFPNISAGNIGYKIAARLGGFTAMGPLLQGLNAPINDLSRGCVWEEVYNNAIITANQTLMD